MKALMDLVSYLAWCVADGDWANDYLANFGPEVQEVLVEIGKAVALIFGS